MVYNHSTVSAAVGHLSEEIVKTPSKDLNFPVCLDLTYRIKEVMDNESSSIHDIAQVVKTDPLTSSKLIGLANSALFYGASKVKDIESAVNRLGIIKVRNLSTAIAISQFTSSENMEHFSPLAKQIWRHSVCTAVAAERIALRFTKFNPQQAFYLGLIHDIGAFYLLYRASEYTVLQSSIGEVTNVAKSWHTGLGILLLMSLGVPEDIAMSIKKMQNIEENVPIPPSNMGEVLYIANAMASRINYWEEANQEAYPLPSAYVEMIPEISLETDKMIAGLL